MWWLRHAVWFRKQQGVKQRAHLKETTEAGEKNIHLLLRQRVKTYSLGNNYMVYIKASLCYDVQLSACGKT